jgi:hypothetical protein
VSILLAPFAIADDYGRSPNVVSDSKCVGWKHNATAGWKPAVQLTLAGWQPAF